MIAGLARSHAAIEQAALSELSGLTPPRSLARWWRAQLAYRRTLVRQLNQMVGYAQHSDAAGIQSFAVSSERVKQRLLAAGRAGFEDCARVE